MPSARRLWRWFVTVCQVCCFASRPARALTAEGGGAELGAHLRALAVGANDFAERWLKRLFVGALPEQVVLRVFDAFLSEGAVFSAHL